MTMCFRKSNLPFATRGQTSNRSIDSEETYIGYYIPRNHIQKVYVTPILFVGSSD